MRSFDGTPRKSTSRQRTPARPRPSRAQISDLDGIAGTKYTYGVGYNFDLDGSVSQDLAISMKGTRPVGLYEHPIHAKTLDTCGSKFAAMSQGRKQREDFQQA